MGTTTFGAGSSPSFLREVFGHFPSAVVVLAARAADTELGMVASTFVPVSLAPPLVSVCVQNTSWTWNKLRELPSLGISLLGDAQEDVARALTARTADRFAGVPTVSAASGAMFISGTNVWIEASIDQLVAAGDHTLAILRVVDVEVHADGAPIVFHRSRYRRLRP